MSTEKQKARKPKMPITTQEPAELDAFGDNVSFAAKEAYKLLRTNLSYILTCWNLILHETHQHANTLSSR